MPLVFLHGITVRHERFERLLKSVTSGLADAGCELTVSGCYWGDLGRSSAYTGASTPGFAVGSRSVGEPAPTGTLSGLLMLLLEDPLAELADLRDAEEFGIQSAGFRPVPQQAQRRNDALRVVEASVTDRVVATEAELDGPEVAPNARVIAALVHDVFSAAARADRSLDAPALCAPMARAITAGLCGAVSRSDDLFGEFRWNATAAAMQDVLNDYFGGQRGMFSDVGARALTLALRHGLRNRIMPGLSLFLGDVFAWFRNRDEILGRVDEAIVEAGKAGPLVLVGHSLGGVIAYEYCVQTDRDVMLLATVGSQVGLFGELGALNAMTRSVGGKLTVPTQVGTWRNFYEPADALSFLAAPIFDRVTDIELNTRAPFPIAHSEYWNMPDTYQKLAAAVSSQ